MSQQFPNVFVLDSGAWLNGKVVRELPDGRVVVRLSKRETVTRAKHEVYVKPESRRDRGRFDKDAGQALNKSVMHKRRDL